MAPIPRTAIAISITVNNSAQYFSRIALTNRFILREGVDNIHTLCTIVAPPIIIYRIRNFLNITENCASLPITLLMKEALLHANISSQIRAVKVRIAD